MPRYYIEIHDGDWGHTDEDGMDHPSDRHAGHEAINALTHIAKDNLPSRDERDFTAEVKDESGQVVFQGTMSFRGGVEPLSARKSPAQPVLAGLGFH
ncbi:DUF6894 family protein [Methylobacterium gnaphalii]|uniref:DUF6894 domain-containing protein n=1 Tax=Methylobacterium gnaphalii TaxID=1010610 RepID=A0A512JS05_9HYPH|nr:hypothetical protein [Methylobacterium gnaphalii]GEP12746.1 hypothetical protein MGN01_45910 [Methylobacterium gnaphalii]GJD71387.1 hypothetical protein MMMDOFMJ_4343 [Methylobacterium gnaphalii]GLS50968.1 hypothetical protein GCM10007885_38220 [Methylobacterium gnaphalii]